MYFMISNEIVRKVPDTESRGFCRLHLPFAQARSSNSERSERSIFHQRSVINGAGLFAQPQRGSERRGASDFTAGLCLVVRNKARRQPAS